MRHGKALLIKFVVITIVLFWILPMFHTANLLNIFFISLIVTGTAYLLGDLFILPRVGNLIATLADFGLAFVSIWLFSYFLLGPGYPLAAASFFASLVITFSEALFHVYMNEKVLKSQRKVGRIFSTQELQTEFAEEKNISDLRKRKE